MRAQGCVCAYVVCVCGRGGCGGLGGWGLRQEVLCTGAQEERPLTATHICEKTRGDSPVVLMLKIMNEWSAFIFIGFHFKFQPHLRSVVKV